VLFHAGALLRLNELGLGSGIARISSVSGGSIAPGYLASVWSALGTSFAGFKDIYVEPDRTAG
jgi:NTE family protein